MSKLFDLTGRRALVTGSNQGIGLALATGLAEHGAEVVLNGRNADKLELAVTRLREAGHEASGATFDVTDGAAAKAAVDRLEADTGPIDILIE